MIRCWFLLVWGFEFCAEALFWLLGTIEFHCARAVHRCWRLMTRWNPLAPLLFLLGFCAYCTHRAYRWLVKRRLKQLAFPIVWVSGALEFHLAGALHACVRVFGRWSRASTIQGLLGIFFYCTGAAYHWLATRQLKYLLQGLPALLVAGTIGLVLLAQALKPKIKDIERYQSAANRALAADDHEAADVWLRKLWQLGVDNAETRFRMTLVAQQLGRQQRAERLLKELAPEDGVGYPPAHFWISQQIAARSRAQQAETAGEAGNGPGDKEEDRRITEGICRAGPGTLDPRLLERMIHHLRAALDSRFAAEAHWSLGRIFLGRGEEEKAIEHLQAVGESEPAALLLLGQLYQRQGRAARAERSLDTAARHFSQQVTEDPQNHRARLAWAEALRLKGQWGEAERCLAQGLGVSDDARYQRALAGLYVQRFDAIEQETAQETAAERGAQGPPRAAAERSLRSLAQRLELLDRALQVAPDHPRALARMATVMHEIRSTRQLKQLLAAGRATATLHLVMAYGAAQDNRPEALQLHLTQAERTSAKAAAVLSNLAWLLAGEQEGELQRALAVAELAIKLAPQQPHVRATRGHILARMQHWDEAARDLEFALAEIQTPELHQMLAMAYGKLGEHEKADRIREERAENLKRVQLEQQEGEVRQGD